MYHRFKYIVGEVKGTYSDLLCAVVFPETIGHDEMKGAFIKGTIVGAGFGHIDSWSKESAFPLVYGESTSLQVKSRDEDLKHVQRALALVPQ